MKTVRVNKKSKVNAPNEFQDLGVVAFQMVEFIISYFGNEIVCEHDTKIMRDGRQFVIGGDGFIKDGFEIFE